MQGRIEPATLDMKWLWPFPPGRTFVYDNGEHIRHEWWEDRSHFTVRHLYYPDDPARPPTEDVMVWRGTRLYYTDTYVWGDGDDKTEGHTHSVLEPGQVWADRHMTVNAAAECSYTNHRSFKMANSGTELHGERSMDGRGTDDICWRRLVGGITLSCPYTDRVAGGPVEALRLDETTYARRKRGFWKEEHFFWRDPSVGWICIASHGCEGREDKRGRQTVTGELWDTRLTEVV